jgi:hypothetical protein
MNRVTQPGLREEILYTPLVGLLFQRRGQVGSLLGSFRGGGVLL